MNRERFQKSPAGRLVKVGSGQTAYWASQQVNRIELSLCLTSNSMNAIIPQSVNYFLKHALTFHFSLFTFHLKW